MIETNNENQKICGECGGQCCRNIPGCCFPEDLGPDLEGELRRRLKSGRYSIDWYESSEPQYYLRPATAEKRGYLRDPSWGGVCNFFHRIRCELEWKDRPKECRLLEPKPDKLQCVSNLGKKEAKDAWLPYTEIILRVLQELEGS